MATDISYQNGSVRQKGGQWYYRFRIQQPDGSWKLKEFKGGKGKRETEYMLRQALDDYNATRVIYDPGNITVSDLITEWWEKEIEYSQMASTSRGGLRNAINHIRAHPLGDTRLKDVTIEMIQDYVDLKSFGAYDKDGKCTARSYAPSTLRKHFTVLNGIFKFAVYPKQYLRENFMQYIQVRRPKKEVDLFGVEEENVDTITFTEYERIIDFLESNEEYEHFKLPLQISYFTGMREGEVSGLSWQDIDFENQSIMVRRSMYYDDETKCWELKIPKSSKPRKIEFGNTLFEILKAAKKKQFRNQTEYGIYYHQHFYQTNELKGRVHWQIFTKAYTDNGVLSSRITRGKFIDDAVQGKELNQLYLVCLKPSGEMITPQSLRNFNKLIQKRLPDISHFHFHCLRHTYASNMVQHGANIKDVQILMGHADIRQTLDTYTHTNTESRKEAVNILEKAVGD